MNLYDIDGVQYEIDRIQAEIDEKGFSTEEDDRALASSRRLLRMYEIMEQGSKERARISRFFMWVTFIIIVATIAVFYVFPLPSVKN